MSTVDLLDRIDEVTTAVCAQCTRPLGDSPSDDFCSQDCQTRWTAHQHDVQDLVGYLDPWDRPREFPGAGHESARWEPTVTVETWTVTASWASGLLLTAEASAHEQHLPPVPLGVVVPTTYVRPERTERPADDILVCAVAATWADSLGLHDEAATARKMRDQAQYELWERLTSSLTANFAELGRGLAVGFERVKEALAPLSSLLRQNRCDPVPHPPRPDVAQAALDARRNRNTGPMVHADPRRNRHGRG